MTYITPRKMRYHKNCIAFTGSDSLVCAIPSVNIAAIVMKKDRTFDPTTITFLMTTGAEIKVYTSELPESDKESWNAYKTFMEAWQDRFETKKESPSLNQF